MNNTENYDKWKKLLKVLKTLCEMLQDRGKFINYFKVM